jgi:hypothetical protein
LEVDNNRQLFTTHGLHLNRLGKELLSSHLLLHIYSALEVEKGSTITLAWQNNHSQIIPSIAVSNNQNLTTKDIISDKLVDSPCIIKESSDSNAAGRAQIGRTSSRLNKATISRSKDFFMAEVNSNSSRLKHIVFEQLSSQKCNKNGTCKSE